MNGSTILQSEYFNGASVPCVGVLLGAVDAARVGLKVPSRAVVLYEAVMLLAGPSEAQPKGLKGQLDKKFSLQHFPFTVSHTQWSITSQVRQVLYDFLQYSCKGHSLFISQRD